MAHKIHCIHDLPDGIVFGVRVRDQKHSHEFIAHFFLPSSSSPGFCWFSEMEKSAAAHRYDKEEYTGRENRFMNLRFSSQQIDRFASVVGAICSLTVMEERNGKQIKSMESLSGLRRSRSYSSVLIKAEEKEKFSTPRRPNRIIAAHTHTQSIQSEYHLTHPQTRKATTEYNLISFLLIPNLARSILRFPSARIEFIDVSLLSAHFCVCFVALAILGRHSIDVQLCAARCQQQKQPRFVAP